MAEIKSTLDLIMERTKNLTLTGEERAVFHRMELQNRVRGWVGRYREGLIGIGDLGENLKENQEDESLIRELLREEVLQNIDPDENPDGTPDGTNEKLLQLLSTVVGIHTAPIIHFLDAYRKEVERQRIQYAEAARRTLEGKGIRGSAIIPNLVKDEKWASWLATSRTAFTKSLSREITGSGTSTL